MSLAAHQLACTRGDRQLFEALDFDIGPGDALWIAGPNGSGKTSLLRLLCGLAYPAAGEVRWKGQDVRSIRDEFYRQLVYLGHMPGVKDDLLAWENIVVGSTLSGTPVAADAARNALRSLGLGHAVELPTRSLSQGQRKRVALARLQLDKDSPLWILDEPFTALDQAAVETLCGTLSAHLARGGMVVYTTHQEIVLEAGRLVRLELKPVATC